MARSICDLVAAERLRSSVDDHLRREHVAVAAHARIGALSVAMARKGERVLPAEVIPIVDREA